MFTKADKVEHITCKFLNLDFPSVSDREKFNRDLKVALRLRDKDDTAVRKVSGNAEFLSHKPNHNTPTEQMAAFPSSRPSSMVSNNNNKSFARRTSSTAPLPGRFSQSPTFVGSPALGTSYDKMAAFPLSRGSSAISNDTHIPAGTRTSPRVPLFDRVSVSPVFSDPFPWTSDLEAVDFPVDTGSPATQKSHDPDLGIFSPVSQQSLRPADLEIHSDNLGWAIHSGDPWFPGKT